MVLSSPSDVSSDDESSSIQNFTILFKNIKEGNWNAVLRRLESNPSEAKLWATYKDCDGEVSWKRLPIHEACIHNPTADVIKALILAHPKSVEAKDLIKRLPLHHAAVHGASYAVVQALLMAYPESVEEEDDFGKTANKCMLSPLNQNDGKNEVMRLLSEHIVRSNVAAAAHKGKTFAEKLEESQQRFDKKLEGLLQVTESIEPIESFLSNEFKKDRPSNENSTELFRAISNKDWTNVVQCLTKSPAESKVWTSCKDYNGDVTWKRLPIHEASMHNPPTGVMRRLVDAYPEGVDAKDMNEKLPIHYAAFYGASLEVVEILLKANPNTLEAKNCFGKTPLLCTQKSTPSEVVEALSKNAVEYTVVVAKEEWENAQKEKFAMLEQKLIKKYEDKYRSMPFGNTVDNTDGQSLSESIRSQREEVHSEMLQLQDTIAELKRDSKKLQETMDHSKTLQKIILQQKSVIEQIKKESDKMYEERASYQSKAKVNEQVLMETVLRLERERDLFKEEKELATAEQERESLKLKAMRLEISDASIIQQELRETILRQKDELDKVKSQYPGEERKDERDDSELLASTSSMSVKTYVLQSKSIDGLRSQMKERESKVQAGLLRAAAL